MSSNNDDATRHQIAAIAFWEQRRHRESANEYWKSFVAFPSLTHKFRYHIFDGYNSILREEYFKADQDDLKNLARVLRDKHEPRLFRVAAGFTLGILYYGQSERFKSEEMYQEAVRIGEKKPKNKNQEKLDKKVVQHNGQNKPMIDIMKQVLKDGIHENLNQMNAATRDGVIPSGQMISDGTFKAHQTFSHNMPVGQRGTDLTQEHLNNLIDVGGIYCDCCKKKTTKLLQCSGCNKTFYCSKECQKKQWKENGHKIYCRKDGEYKPGDLVRIARLKNKTDLNNCMMRIVGTGTEIRR